jgi:hypothetical protein
MAKINKKTLKALSNKKTTNDEVNPELLEMLKHMRKPVMGQMDRASTYVAPESGNQISTNEMIKYMEENPGPGAITLKDKRKILSTSQKPIRPNVDLKGGEYDGAIINEILSAAKRYNYDPYTALAVGLQESTLGKAGENIGHTLYESTIPSVLPNSNAVYDDLNSDEKVKRNIDNMVRFLIEKKKEANKNNLTGELQELQAYNGYKLKPETELDYYGHPNKMAYGVVIPEEGLNLKQNPLYGKQIVDLKENVLKKNPELLKMVTNYYKKNKNKNVSLKDLINKKNGETNQ